MSKLKYSIMLGRNLIFLAKASEEGYQRFIGKTCGDWRMMTKVKNWADGRNGANLNDAMEIAENAGFPLDILCKVDLSNKVRDSIKAECEQMRLIDA